MAQKVLTNVGVWIDGHDFAGVSNKAEFELSADAPDSTPYKNSSRRRTAGGLKTFPFSLEGFHDIGVIDAFQLNSLGGPGNVLLVPDGENPGDPCYVLPLQVTGFAPVGTIGELMTYAYAGEGRGMPYRAQVLDIRDGVSADTVAPHYELGDLASGESIHVWVHVTHNNGTVRVRLRSKATAGGGFTNRIDLGSITSTGLYTGSFAGPVTHRFWELHYNVTGTSDFDFAGAAVIA